MNGKKRYVAIVLFLIIGLGSFVFASPEEEGNGPKKENDKTVEQQGSKEPVNNENEFETEEPNEELVENETTTTVVTNPTNPVVDNSYALALAAVKELEEILNDEKANTATELVDKVTNQTQKEALAERVENAKNAITAEELVSELEDMVANATSKDNLISALGFRDETAQPAVDKIGGDQLAEVKEELTKRIDDLAAILEDNEAPIIEASTKDKEVVNTGHYNKDVTVTVKDAVVVTVTKDGSDYGFQDKYTENGTYVVLAVDEAFNEAELQFTIDKVKPKIKGVSDGAYYNTSVTPIIEEENVQNVTVKKDGNKYTKYTVGASLTEDGTYQMRMTDKAGNKFDYITFVIDTKAATVESVTYTPNTLTNGKVTVTITYSEEIKEVTGWTLTDDKKGIYREFDENVTSDVTVFDLAGNETKQAYEVKNIDKVSPTLTITYKNGKTEVRGSDNITTNLRYVVKKGETLVDDFYGADRGVGNFFTIQWHASTYGEGEYTVTVYDEAGNSATTTAMVDVTKPTLTITYKNGKTEVRGSDNITTNLRYIIKKGDVLVDDFYGADRGVGNFFTIQWHAATYGDGEYTVEVIDEVGNSTKDTAIVDTTKPTLTITYKNGKTEVRGSDNITTNLRYVVKKGETLVDDFYGSDRGVGNFFTIQWHAATYGEGEYTITIYDEVGNSATTTAIVDVTAPEYATLRMLGGKEIKENGVQTWYVRADQDINVYMTFKEKLAVNAKVKVNGEELPTTYVKEVDGTYMYMATYRVTKNSKQGAVSIEVYGYADEVGNVGTTLTNEHITTPGQKNVTIDTIAPTLTKDFREDLLEKKTDIVATDLHSITLYAYKDGILVKTYPGGNSIRTNFDWWGNGNYRVVARDLVGNESEITYIIAKSEFKIENGVVNIDKDTTIWDDSLYYDETGRGLAGDIINASGDVIINGNGKTITQKASTRDSYMNWVTSYKAPTMTNIFASKNGSLTVNNLTLTGQTTTNTIGFYAHPGKKSVFNNVTMKDLEVVSFSQVAAGLIVYGEAELNNTIITGTKMSSMDQAGFPLYDMALVQDTNLVMNGGEVGSVYLWNKAKATFNNVKIDTIYTATRSNVKGHVTIGEGTVVNKIIAKANLIDGTVLTHRPNSIIIKSGANVKILDLSEVDLIADVKIEAGANVEKIITKFGEMTLDEFKSLSL